MTAYWCKRYERYIYVYTELELGYYISTESENSIDKLLSVGGWSKGSGYSSKKGITAYELSE